MKPIAWLSMSAAALLLAACGEADETAEDAAPSEQTSAQDETATGTGSGETGVGLSRLDQAAEDACRAEGVDAVLAVLPEGASFTSRGPDAYVEVACKLEDRREYYRFRSVDLPEAIRTGFDSTVANHMRFGLRPGDDRSNTGVYRMRDGRFCAVQTDPALGRTACEAAAEADAALAEDAGEE